MSVNKVILIGRLGKDAKHFNKHGVAFSLVTNTYSWDKARGEKIEHTDWHRVVVNMEEELDYCKGDQVYVEGLMRTRSWGEGAAKKYITEVIAKTHYLIARKGE